jgi:hypothetical protein
MKVILENKDGDRKQTEITKEIPTVSYVVLGRGQVDFDFSHSENGVPVYIERKV